MQIARRSVGWLAASVFMAALGSGACVQSRGVFRSDAFVHTTYHYNVLRSFLDSQWLLDSHHMSRGELVPKTSPEFVSTFRLDTDGDGRSDVERREPRFDLRFKHRQRGGVVWLRTFPIARDLRDKELRVLMQSYIDEIAGAGYESVDLEDPDVVEKRYAAEILERGQAKLAGRSAYVATIDVANIDQVHVTPASRRTRVRLIMVQTTFSYPVGKKSKFPVLMMAGYSNLPDDFATDLPSFDRFLGQIEIEGQRGWAVGALERLSPDKRAATPSAAPAAVQ